MSASYYAVNAKVRALYGRRMTAEDYRLLQEKRTIPEAAAFLQADLIQSACIEKCWK